MSAEPATKGSVPTAPGILFVGSKTLDSSVLPPLNFCDWYENTHIPEINKTGGFSNTQRYESLDFMKKHRGLNVSNAPANKGFAYDFLTTYNMPDLHFRDTEEYKSLSGQARPNDQQLVDKLFKRAEFFSRFCEQMAVDWPDEGGPDAPYLVTLTSSSGPAAADLASKITKFSGCKRTRTFKVHEGSVLSALERTYIPEKSDLFLFDFNDLDRVSEVVKLSDGSGDVQVGFWGLRKTIDGSERSPKKWKPTN